MFVTNYSTALSAFDVLPSFSPIKPPRFQTSEPLSLETSEHLSLQVASAGDAKCSLFLGNRQEIQEDAEGNNTTLNNVTDITLGGLTTTSQLKISNGSAPSTPSGGGVLYVENGALKYKGALGSITTLANS